MKADCVAGGRVEIEEGEYSVGKLSGTSKCLKSNLGRWGNQGTKKDKTD